MPLLDIKCAVLAFRMRDVKKIRDRSLSLENCSLFIWGVMGQNRREPLQCNDINRCKIKHLGMAKN